VLHKNLVILAVFLLNVFICAQVSQISGTKTVYMIGNSTMADKPYKNGNPEKGWGQIFPLYFKDGIRIENHAVNGRSTKSFLDEGRWNVVLEKIRTDDYVIIEFGHNDSKKDDPKRFADANTDYRINLIKFVNETRSKGGIPILATPIVRRRFDDEGKFYDVHGDYPKVVREVASELNVLLLDLHKRTEEMLIDFGKERSKLLFLLIDPTEYKSLPEGRTDNTHLSAYGAFKVCDLAAEEIRNLIPELAIFLKD
jgi:lysophospholipase L1-like esterase